MPRSSATSAKTKPSRVPLYIFAALIVLIVGGLAGWKLYHNQQVAADKTRFAQAERDIDELSRQVLTEVGPPTKSETQKYCSRPNMKFEEGPLSCDVHWYGFYEVNSAEEATVIYQKTRKIFETKWPKTEYKSLSFADNNRFEDFIELSSEKVDQRIRGAFQLNNAMLCAHWSGMYPGNNPEYKDLYRSVAAKYVLSVDFSCSEKAKVEHFPMKS